MCKDVEAALANLWRSVRLLPCTWACLLMMPVRSFYQDADSAMQLFVWHKDHRVICHIFTASLSFDKYQLQSCPLRPKLAEWNSAIYLSLSLSERMQRVDDASLHPEHGWQAILTEHQSRMTHNTALKGPIVPTKTTRNQTVEWLVVCIQSSPATSVRS